MDCACLFHKICGYYNKGVYVQLIRSTTKGYFWGQQHDPVWKCIYMKNKPTKHARNLGNLTKRTSELHERAINPRKDRIAICSRKECRKGFNFCWKSKALVECRGRGSQSQHHKDRSLEGALHIRGAYFHAFQTNGQTVAYAESFHGGFHSVT